MKVPVLIAAIVLLVASFAAQSAESEQMKSGRSPAILGQWHGNSYSGSEFSVAKIYTADRWRRFWWEHLGREHPVDFDESLHQAVYIELGVRPTGGYAVNVVRVYEEDKNLVLEYSEREPSPDQYVTQALTSPWVMVLLPRSDLRVMTREVKNK